MNVDEGAVDAEEGAVEDDGLEDSQGCIYCIAGNLGVTLLKAPE